ncbi:MAG: hypothetical protein IT535_07865 [Bauldia sp.]|nr:hypothetical protein [Bauldia sp.]
MSPSTKTVRILPVRIELAPPVPEIVDVGAAFQVRLAIEATFAAGLSGAPFTVREEDSGAAVLVGRLPEVTRISADSFEYDPRHGPVDLRDRAVLTLRAPSEIGSFRWRVELPEYPFGNVVYAAASVSLHFETKEHVLSLAVWDNPSPVSSRGWFGVKVGAKCSAGCDLADEPIEIVDAEGAVVGCGELGIVPWSGTECLHWTMIDVLAPAGEGLRRWSARIGAGFGRAHHGRQAGASFSCVVTKPPECLLTIEVVDKDKNAPVADIVVRSGPYRSVTDREGKAFMRVPRGTFRLAVLGDNIEAPSQTIEIDEDKRVTIAARVLPERDPYERYWRT